MRDEPTTIGMEDLRHIRCNIRSSYQRLSSDKLTPLFEPRHARWYDGINFQIARSMGDSVPTSFLE